MVTTRSWRRRKSRWRRTPCSTARWAPAVCTSPRRCTPRWASRLQAELEQGQGAGRDPRSALVIQAGFNPDDLRGVRELGREIGDRTRIDFALVPLLEHREIRTAGLPVLAAVPAIARQIVRGGGQHVGCAAQEVAPAVAVEIDGVLDPGRWHELRLSDFAGPGAAHFRR